MLVRSVKLVLSTFPSCHGLTRCTSEKLCWQPLSMSQYNQDEWSRFASKVDYGDGADVSGSEQEVQALETSAWQRFSARYSDIHEEQSIDVEDEIVEADASPLFSVDIAANQPQSKRGRPNKFLKEFLASTPSGSHCVLASASSTSNIGHGSDEDAQFGEAHAHVERQQSLSSALLVRDASRSMPGYHQMSSESKVLLSLVPHASDRCAQLEQASLDVAAAVLDADSYHLSTAAMQQKSLKISWNRISLRQERLACALTLYSKSERWSLEGLLTHNLPLGCLVLYLDLMSYDETPLFTKLDHEVHEPVSMSDIPESASGVAQPYVSNVLGGLNDVQDCLPKLSVKEKCKLLQMRSGFAAFIKVAETSYLFLGQTLMPLAAMETSSAAAIHGALQRNEGVSPFVHDFKHKLRAVVLDRAGSNAKTER
eukprot:5173269-Amphidinium_carterae.1